MHDELHVLVNLSVSLVLALVLGLITERLRLSPIVGYLLAGIALGPHTPGTAADPEMAKEFAEIGVVLLMFGVGLHFNLKELLAVQRIAIPGAVGQIAVATGLGTLAAIVFGYSTGSGIVFGVAASVASTVVLIRVLTDSNLLDAPEGHIAVGWLIVEDIFTVLVLVVLPVMAGLGGQGEEGGNVADLLKAIGMAFVKLALVFVLITVVGRKLIPWLLGYVARTRSRELFTLAVLALALAIATGSAKFFDVSMALGAFLAGTVVGQSEVSHQAAADALPMRDAFAVLFFVSVGMLFDPHVIQNETGLLITLLLIVLVAKPLTALIIVWALKYSVRTALTVAIGLAQVGEFSFVLANEALGLNLITADGQSLLVTSALISISLNPILFRAIGPIENWMRKQKSLWKFLNERSIKGGADINAEVSAKLKQESESEDPPRRAVVVGYGPVGQTASRILQGFGVQTVVIDLNIETVRQLVAMDQHAIYGDSTQRDILAAAGIEQAKYLLVTMPDVMTRTSVIITAKELNQDLRVFVRARYIQERAWLEEVGATDICTEEAETALGLAVLLLREVGADEKRVHTEIERIKRELGIRHD